MTISPCTLTSGHVFPEKNMVQKIHTPQYSLITVYNSQDNGSKLSVHWQVNGQEDVVHIYDGISLSHLYRNEIMPPAATQMDLEIVVWSEISQTETDKHHIIVLICRILQRWCKWPYLETRNRLTGLENELRVTSWGKGAGERDRSGVLNGCVQNFYI